MPSMVTSRHRRKKFPSKSLPAPRRPRVSDIRPEHSQIQFVHAPADLLIGRETDSNQPVLALCLLEQPSTILMTTATPLVVGTEQRGAAGSHDVFAEGGL